MCKICSKMYARKFDMYNHLNRVHKVDKNNADSQIVETARNFEYGLQKKRRADEKAERKETKRFMRGKRNFTREHEERELELARQQLERVAEENRQDTINALREEIFLQERIKVKQFLGMPLTESEDDYENGTVEVRFTNPELLASTPINKT